MDIIYFLIGCSIIIAGLFLAGFIWSIKSGQYDDTYTPSVRMLFDNKVGDDKDNQNNEKADSSQDLA